MTLGDDDHGQYDPENPGAVYDALAATGEAVNVSPPYCLHLMTIEASAADEMSPDAPRYVFTSRCVCGHDIPWGPYPETMRAIGAHLREAGLVGQFRTAQEGEQ